MRKTDLIKQEFGANQKSFVIPKLMDKLTHISFTTESKINKESVARNILSRLRTLGRNEQEDWFRKFLIVLTGIAQ